MSHYRRFSGRSGLLRLVRFEGNPIITSRQGRDWEVEGTFNPGAVIDGGAIHLLYRAVDANKISHLGYAKTLDRTKIDHRSSDPVLMASAEWEEFGCKDPRITNFRGTST